jgi:hypothetical protein
MIMAHLDRGIGEAPDARLRTGTPTINNSRFSHLITGAKSEQYAASFWPGAGDFVG